MKIVLQRVKEASVEAGGRIAGRIGRGICLLVGVERGDIPADAEALARKVTEMRIFPDQKDKMNLSLAEIGGEVLAVSQFTLAGSTRKGRRPSFDGAEDPEKAESIFRHFCESIRKSGFRVETGVFQAAMDVRLINDGPVTFVLDSKKGESEGISR